MDFDGRSLLEAALTIGYATKGTFTFQDVRGMDMDDIKYLEGRAREILKDTGQVE